MSRTSWARLRTPAGPVVVGVVAANARFRALGLGTPAHEPYTVPVGVALVDLTAGEEERARQAQPQGLRVSCLEGLLVVRPTPRVRLRGTPPTAAEAETVLDALVDVLRRAMPSR